MFIKAKAANACARGLVCGPTKGAFLVIMNIWRWEESCHNSLTLAAPTLVTFILGGWQAVRPLHRGSAEKHGWPVDPLDLARLRETQSIFTRVVVLSYFFMI